MAISVSSRKRQSKLDFTPAPSSSPARSEAFIRIADGSSPSKRRRFNQNKPNTTNNLHSTSATTGLQSRQIQIAKPRGHLPTPAPSSQVQLGNELDSDDPENYVFTSSEDLQNADGRNILSLDDNASLKRDSADVEAAVHLSSETELESHESVKKEVPMSVMNTKPKKAPTTRSFIKGGLGGKGRDSRAKKLPQQSKKPHWEHESLGSESDSDEVIPASGSSKRKTASSSLPHRPSPLRRNLRSKSQRDDISNSPSRTLRSLTSPRTRQRELDWQFSGSESGSEDIVNSSRRKLLTRRGAKQASVESPQEDSHNANMISSTEEVKPSASDSDVVITPSRGRNRHISQPASSNCNNREVESDLEEELADLADTDTEVRKNRTRGGPQASERNSRLDKLQELKCRRSGAVIVSDDDEVSSDEAVEDPLEIEDVMGEPAKKLQDGYVENPDEYESDFVDDDGNDGDDVVGIDLASGGVPLELTSFGRQKPVEYFKYEVEWMIHNKLNPAFSRHDEIYELSHRKLDDEFQGQAGSKFLSSVWKQDFVNALKGRPDCHILKVPAMLDEKCTACNRSGHPPSFKITFSGQKYDRRSLDPLSNDEDSDSDITTPDDEDAMEEENFFIGKHCCQNAEIAHTLFHWRYQLNDFILIWLADEQHLTPRKIVEREKWSNKKKEKLANRIHDEMVAGGQISEMFRQFKASLDTAREFKVCSFTYDARDFETDRFIARSIYK